MLNFKVPVYKGMIFESYTRLMDGSGYFIEPAREIQGYLIKIGNKYYICEVMYLGGHRFYEVNPKCWILWL